MFNITNKELAIVGIVTAGVSFMVKKGLDYKKDYDLVSLERRKNEQRAEEKRREEEKKMYEQFTTDQIYELELQKLKNKESKYVADAEVEKAKIEKQAKETQTRIIADAVKEFSDLGPFARADLKSILESSMNV